MCRLYCLGAPHVAHRAGGRGGESAGLGEQLLGSEPVPTSASSAAVALMFVSPTLVRPMPAAPIDPFDIISLVATATVA